MSRTKFINNHKLSQTAHEEIISMTHSDKEVAKLAGLPDWIIKRAKEILKELRSIMVGKKFSTILSSVSLFITKTFSSHS